MKKYLALVNRALASQVLVALARHGIREDKRQITENCGDIRVEIGTGPQLLIIGVSCTCGTNNSLVDDCKKANPEIFVISFGCCKSCSQADIHINTNDPDSFNLLMAAITNFQTGNLLRKTPTPLPI